MYPQMYLLARYRTRMSNGRHAKESRPPIYAMYVHRSSLKG